MVGVFECVRAYVLEGRDDVHTRPQGRLCLLGGGAFRRDVDARDFGRFQRYVDVDQGFALQVGFQGLKQGVLHCVRHGQRGDFTRARGVGVCRTVHQHCAEFGVDLAGDALGFLCRTRSDDDFVPGFGPAQSQSGAFVACAA